MSRPVRVFGWQGWRQECPAARNGSHATREICAAKSMAEVARRTGKQRAAQLFNLTETRNAVETAIAMNEPGIVFWSPLDQFADRTWTRVPPHQEDR